MSGEIGLKRSHTRKVPVLVPSADEDNSSAMLDSATVSYSHKSCSSAQSALWFRDLNWPVCNVM